MATDATSTSPRTFAFGPYRLVPERQLLLRDDVPVRIGGRAFDILKTLVERAGEPVSKRDLMSRVWPETVVDESNLKVNVAALRRTLGDGGPDDVRYVATVTGRGYRFIAPVVTSDSSQLPTAPPQPIARRHNLPTGTIRIVGRADTIDTIRRDFEVSRVVTISGPGGIGKTTVALAVAEHAIDSFRDGVWRVDLSLLKDAALLPNAIATVVGLPNPANTLAALCESLRDRELLLVLDSCEHVIEAAAVCVTQVLAEAARTRILVTSREALRISGERVRRLSGLGTPPPSVHLSAEEALTFPAVQLFVDRATDRLESFELNDADAQTVAEICRRLDGLALAIELAATRIDAFAVRPLLKQLDDRFRLLTGRRAGPERHRTLTATLDWSYGLLSPAEAAMLRAIAVFAGEIDIPGASAIGNLAASEAADLLAQLAAKSLLATEIHADAIRYRLLESTRTYCLERLRDEGEEQATRRRHAHYLYAVLERAASERARRPAVEWAGEYERVLDDLRAALTWAGSDAGQGSLRIRLTVSGLLLWNHFSLTDECHSHVSRAVEEIETSGMSGSMFEMQLKLWQGGSSMFTRGLKPQAVAAMRRALQVANETGDTDGRLRCLMMIAIYELFTGDHETAMGTLSDFAQIATAWDPSVLPEGEVHEGIGELFLGRLHSARRRLELLNQRDLRYFNGTYLVRYLSDPKSLVESVLSQVQWLIGESDSAARTASAAVEHARISNHHLSLNTALSYGCAVFFWRRTYDECERYIQLLDENVAQHGIVARRPVAEFYRAALAWTEDATAPSSIDALRSAIESFRATNHLARMPYYLSVLASALAAGGRMPEAGDTIRSALDVARTQSEEWCLPEVLRVQASLEHLQGRPRAAETLLLESMAVASRIGAASWQLRSAIDLATMWRGEAREQEAGDLLTAIVGTFTEGFSTPDLLLAAELIGLTS